MKKSKIDPFPSLPPIGPRPTPNTENSGPFQTAWWLGHPSEKYEFVNWDDDIPNVSGKMPKMATSHHQPANVGKFDIGQFEF